MITAALMILAWAGFAGTVTALHQLRRAHRELRALRSTAPGPASPPGPVPSPVYDLTAHRQGRNQ